MKRLHIATLGLSRNDLVGYVIRKRPVDDIILVYTLENKDDMETIKAENVSSGIPVHAIEVNPWDYRNVLAGILKAISKYKDRQLEFNPSCGTRVMTAAAYMASLMTDAPVYFVTDPHEEGYGDLVCIHPMSFSMLSEQRKNVLHVIEKKGGVIENHGEIKEDTDLSKSQISKHIKNLAEVGYVEVNKTKRGCVRTTDLGRIVLTMKVYRKGRIWGNQH